MQVYFFHEKEKEKQIIGFLTGCIIQQILLGKTPGYYMNLPDPPRVAPSNLTLAGHKAIMCSVD